MFPTEKMYGTALAVLASAAIYAADPPSAEALAPLSRIIGARGLQGAKTAVRETDRFDRFEYLRSRDAHGLSFTVTSKEAGEWVVLARIRVGASVPMDQEAAYVTLYGEKPETQKLAVERVSGSPGDDCWQTLCIGRFHLKAGMRVEVSPGTKNPPRFVDLRNVVLVRPELMTSSVPLKGGETK